MTPPPGDLRLPGVARFFVRRIELEGNTVYSTALLRRELVEAYENRELSSEDLQALRHRLSLYYLERGYVNSGAVIPDQKVDGGVVTLRIVEGRLTDIEVSGNRALRDAYLRDRLNLDIAQPLNVNDVRRRMQVMQQDPMIGRINAELVPGARPGEAVLRTRIEENEPIRFGVSYGNTRSPAIGSERGEIQLGDMSLTGRGDPLSARFGKTRGLTDFSLSYALPLNARDLPLRLRADRNHSVVLAQPFNVLDIKSRSNALSLGLTYPLIRTPSRELQLGGLSRAPQQQYVAAGHTLLVLPRRAGRAQRGHGAAPFPGMDGARREPGPGRALDRQFRDPGAERDHQHGRAGRPLCVMAGSGAMDPAA